MSDRAGRVFWSVLLGAACALALLRLTIFAERFGRESLQRDFAAFYTAGEALNRGLTPYRTHADHDPPLWDGIDVYAHSRFLYPPLVATFFRPLAALNYPVAKRLWMVFGLACITFALWRWARALGWKPDRRQVMGLVAFVAFFHPLLAHLECGQIDAMTLALLSAALVPMIQDGRERFGSGVIMAAATLLKLNVGYLVVFLMIRRMWRALLGYAVGGVLLLGLTLLANGPAALEEYAYRELPRIARHGERGTSEMLLDSAKLERLRSAAPDGYAVKQGRQYRAVALEIVANASLARLLAARLSHTRTRTGEHRATSAVSLAIILCAGIMAWLVTRRRRGDSKPTWEAEYWYFALAAVIVAGPLTWMMNLVWLLPLAVLVSVRYSLLDNARAAVALAACTTGLLLAAVPDHHSWTSLAPVAARYASWHYVIAGTMVMISLLALLAARDETGASPA